MNAIDAPSGEKQGNWLRSALVLICLSTAPRRAARRAPDDDPETGGPGPESEAHEREDEQGRHDRRGPEARAPPGLGPS